MPKKKQDKPKNSRREQNKKRYQKVVSNIKRRMKSMENRGFIIKEKPPKTKLDSYTKRAIDAIEKKYSKENLYKKAEYAKVDDDGVVTILSGEQGKAYENKARAQKSAETRKRKKQEKENEKQEWSQDWIIEDDEDIDESEGYEEDTTDYDSTPLQPTFFAIEGLVDLIDATIATLEGVEVSPKYAYQIQQRTEYLEGLKSRLNEVINNDAISNTNYADKIDNVIAKNWRAIQEAVEKDIGGYFGKRGEYVAYRTMAFLDNEIFGSLPSTYYDEYDEDEDADF